GHYTAASTCRTRSRIDGQFASADLLTVTKSPSSSRLLTPSMPNNRLATGWFAAASALKKLVGCGEIGRSKTNFSALGLGVGCTSTTLNGIVASPTPKAVRSITMPPPSATAHFKFSEKISAIPESLARHVSLSLTPPPPFG